MWLWDWPVQDLQSVPAESQGRAAASCRIPSPSGWSIITIQSFGDWVGSTLMVEVQSSPHTQRHPQRKIQNKVSQRPSQANS